MFIEVTNRYRASVTGKVDRASETKLIDRASVRTHREDYIMADIRDYRPVGREQNIGDGPVILKYGKKVTARHSPAPPRRGAREQRERIERNIEWLIYVITVPSDANNKLAMALSFENKKDGHRTPAPRTPRRGAGEQRERMRRSALTVTCPKHKEFNDLD